MTRNKRYNPKNCQHRVIAQFEDAFGTKIALLAHHAFTWSIYKDIDGRIETLQLPRKEARREYKRLEKAYKQHLSLSNSIYIFLKSRWGYNYLINVIAISLVQMQYPCRSVHRTRPNSQETSSPGSCKSYWEDIPIINQL